MAYEALAAAHQPRPTFLILPGRMLSLLHAFSDTLQVCFRQDLAWFRHRRSVCQIRDRPSLRAI